MKILFCNIRDIFLVEYLLSTRELSDFTVIERILGRKNMNKSGKKEWKLKLGLSKLIKTHLNTSRTGNIFDIVKSHYNKKTKQNKTTYTKTRKYTFILFIPTGTKLWNHFLNLPVSCS